MIEYTNQMMLFKELSSKELHVDFDGGDMSSDGGLLILREVEAKHQIIKKVTEVMYDKRHPSYIKHDIEQLLSQRVFQIAAGYEDGNDSDELRHDPIMKLSCNKLPASDDSLASQPTMCRFENTPSRTTLYRIADKLVDVFIESYKKPPEAIILDFDDTADQTYGDQQLTLFNGYYGCHCYLPLHIYEGASGRLITTILRPGKRPSGKEVVMILKRIVKKLRAAWPNVGIMYRGDAHYSSPEVYDFCEDNNIKFALGQKSYAPFLKRADNLINKAKELYDIKQKPIKLYGEFLYQANSWSKTFRIIFKAEHNHKGPNVRFIVTNFELNNRPFIYEKVYCGRGSAELMIKEHKNHLKSDRTSCTSFEANQFRLFLHSIAYMLMHTFRREYLNQTQFSKAQFDTVRLKLIKIGARVRELATRVKIHLPSSYAYKDDFFRIWNTCRPPGFAS